MATFLIQEAQPYWEAEMLAYLSGLEKRMPSDQYAKLKVEQEAWSKHRHVLEERITRKHSHDEGTADMFLYQLELTDVPRKRALLLGCKLEGVSSASRARQSEKPQPGN